MLTRLTGLLLTLIIMTWLGEIENVYAGQIKVRKSHEPFNAFSIRDDKAKQHRFDEMQRLQLLYQLIPIHYLYQVNPDSLYQVSPDSLQRPCWQYKPPWQRDEIKTTSSTQKSIYCGSERDIIVD